MKLVLENIMKTEIFKFFITFITFRLCFHIVIGNEIFAHFRRIDHMYGNTRLTVMPTLPTLCVCEKLKLVDEVEELKKLKLKKKKGKIVVIRY